MDQATLAGLIVSVILERPTCLVCVAAKVGQTQLATLRAIERIGKTLHLDRPAGERCRACGSTVAPVFVLSRR